MFFRRVFSKKENNPPTFPPPSNSRFGDSSSSMSPARLTRRTSSEDKQKGLSVLQLTPLWEHIIRTGTLPEGINLAEMFDEFLERLHDPEWQVRQHALRVLVDVLSIMRQSADMYASQLMAPLVENLGHAAPAVRKGALDALRVYISEASMPETVIIEIIELGMEQKLSNENFAGRLAVGVMLALPALIQPALMTVKRSFILRSVLLALSNKMIQITYQEVALKSIIKIRDMIGQRDFHDFMPYNAKKEFEMHCNAYGINGTSTLRDSGIDLNAPSSTESKIVWQNGNIMPKLNGYVPNLIDRRLGSSMQMTSNITENGYSWQLNSSLKTTRNSGTDTSQDNMIIANNNDKIFSSDSKLLKRQSSFVRIKDSSTSSNESDGKSSSHEKRNTLVKMKEYVTGTNTNDSRQNGKLVKLSENSETDFLSDSLTSWSNNQTSGMESSEGQKNSFVKMTDSSTTDMSSEAKPERTQNSPVKSIIKKTENSIRINATEKNLKENMAEINPEKMMSNRPKTSPIRNKNDAPETPKKQKRGKSANAKSNQQTPSIEVCWKNENESEIDGKGNVTGCPSNGDYDIVDPQQIRPDDKIIMETEIQLSEDTALTMRILEAQASQDLLSEDSDDETSSRSTTKHDESVLRVMSDSEFDETFETDDATPRTPRRVRFGGEVVKMRTPDSDALQSDMDEALKTQLNSAASSGQSTPSGQLTPTTEQIIPLTAVALEKTETLQIEIPSDNTKPIARPKTAITKVEKAITEQLSPTKVELCKEQSKLSMNNSDTFDQSDNYDSTLTPSNSPKVLPEKSLSPNLVSATSFHQSANRSASASPKRQRRKFSTTLPDDLLSPTAAHREVQVLHNLARSPSISPTRNNRKNSGSYLNEDNMNNNDTDDPPEKHFNLIQTSTTLHDVGDRPPSSATVIEDNRENSQMFSDIIKPKRWDELGIVDNDVLYDLKSGVSFTF